MKKSADKGNVDAIYFYADMLFYGEGASVDYEESLCYYKKAADKGKVQSMLRYAYLCFEGIGTPVNYKESLIYYRMLAEKGYREGMYGYGLILYEGLGVEADELTASKLFKKAADDGYVESMFKYGQIMRNVRPKEALYYLKKATEKGHLKATYYYALTLTSYEVDLDENEISRLYKTAADGGVVAAMIIYARYLCSRKQNSSDIEEAIHYYKMAFEKDEPVAFYFLGKMYQEGDGVNVDINEAIKLYKMAMEKGDMNSQLAYALMLKNGVGVQAD